MVNKGIKYKGFKSSLLFSITFGATGSLIGLLLHAAWGNVEEITYTIANGFFIGFFIGLAEPLFSRSFIKNLPYYVVLFLRILLYFSLIGISIYVFMIIYLKSEGLGSEALRDDVKFEEIKTVYFLANVSFQNVLVIVIATTFLWQLKSFFGKGVLLNYLIGKYHKPIVEERIFMFLDLNEATTIAENLGTRKYSSLLQSFFIDLDDAIIKSKGQVFQYVGDEVVIIWDTKQGLKKSNCINAFVMALENLEKNKAVYLKAYGVHPQFKAALHIGEVSITEIGVSKKEIAYHGDVINTTARICGSAHKLGRKLLISKALHERLPKPEWYTYIELGEHSFKGKDEKIELYGIDINEEISDNK